MKWQNCLTMSIWQLTVFDNVWLSWPLVRRESIFTETFPLQLQTGIRTASGRGTAQWTQLGFSYLWISATCVLGVSFGIFCGHRAFQVNVDVTSIQKLVWLLACVASWQLIGHNISNGLNHCQHCQVESPTTSCTDPQSEMGPFLLDWTGLWTPPAPPPLIQIRPLQSCTESLFIWTTCVGVFKHSYLLYGSQSFIYLFFTIHSSWVLHEWEKRRWWISFNVPIISFCAFFSLSPFSSFLSEEHLSLCCLLVSAVHALYRRLISILSPFNCSSVHVERMLQFSQRIKTMWLN